MSQKLLPFSASTVFTFYYFFSLLERSNFHFAQKSFAFNTKDILLVREQKTAFNCSPPVWLTVGTLFLRHENIFQLTAYGFIHWTFIACVVTYFPGQFITRLCVFLAMTTLCRDFLFSSRLSTTNFTFKTGKIFSATPNDLTIFSSAKSDFFIHPKVGNFNIIKITAM